MSGLYGFSHSSAPTKLVSSVQFSILSPEEIVFYSIFKFRNQFLLLKLQLMKQWMEINRKWEDC